MSLEASESYSRAREAYWRGRRGPGSGGLAWRRVMAACRGGARRELVAAGFLRAIRDGRARGVAGLYIGVERSPEPTQILEINFRIRSGSVGDKSLDSYPNSAQFLGKPERREKGKGAT